MLKRKIYDQILKWGESPYDECLLIEGARQVGKTFIVRHFLKERCPNHLIIDFSIDPDYSKIFDGSVDVDRIIAEISLRFPRFKPVPGKTVIFFDEIQICPRARTALKAFVVDGRYRVIASGSLLGLTYGTKRKEDILPMGYEKSIGLGPLDFEEFLWAIGIDDNAIGNLRRHIRDREPFPDGTLEVTDRYFSIYMLVGGMPEVVDKYVRTQKLPEVREVQKKIVKGYRDDIKKYADTNEQDKTIASFDSIPAQLAQDNKKFKYAIIDDRFVPTFSTYERGLNWMSDAGVMKRSFNVTNPKSPLDQFAKPKQFKAYMCDTGLLTSLYNQDVAHSVMTGDKRVNKGAIAENIVAQCLTSNGHKLYYFSTNSMEIDFIVTLGCTVTAIEVKSGNNTKAKSLKSAHDNYGVKRMMKFENTNIKITNDGVEHYPFFVCAFMDSLYDEPNVDISL